MGEFFAVCQENHTRLKLDKCEFMQETLQYLGLEFGMRKNILQKSELRQNNRSFHMKQEQKIAHFMKNTLFIEKMRNLHPNQSHCDASGSTISSLKHSLCF